MNTTLWILGVIAFAAGFGVNRGMDKPNRILQLTLFGLGIVFIILAYR